VNDFATIAAELKRVEAEKAEMIGAKPEQATEYTFYYPPIYFAPDDYMA
jgi:hypothetical protein